MEPSGRLRAMMLFFLILKALSALLVLLVAFIISLVALYFLTSCRICFWKVLHISEYSIFSFAFHPVAEAIMLFLCCIRCFVLVVNLIVVGTLPFFATFWPASVISLVIISFSSSRSKPLGLPLLLQVRRIYLPVLVCNLRHYALTFQDCRVDCST